MIVAFRTGDTGSLDRDGFLHVLGRQSDVIVLPDGKKISPEELERRYEQSPYIREVALLAPQGELLALVVTPADASDRAQVGELAEAVQAATGDHVTLAFVDQGYTGQPAAEAAGAHGIALEVVKLPEAKRGFVLLPRRWVVERTFAWLFSFRTDTGYVNHWLNALTFGVWDATFDWFGSWLPAMSVIMISEIWKTTPFMSLLLLAGLAQVPNDLQEAAMVDGATWWQRLRRVTLPNMQGAIMVAVLFRVVDAFRIFDNVFIMTSGAQGTETLSILAYRQTITRTEIGLGSAVSVLLFLSVALICFIFIKVFRTDLARARGE